MVRPGLLITPPPPSCSVQEGARQQPNRQTLFGTLYWVGAEEAAREEPRLREGRRVGRNPSDEQNDWTQREGEMARDRKAKWKRGEGGNY